MLTVCRIISGNATPLSYSALFMWKFSIVFHFCTKNPMIRLENLPYLNLFRDNECTLYRNLKIEPWDLSPTIKAK